MHPLLLTDASTTFLKYHASTAIDYVDNIPKIGPAKMFATRKQYLYAEFFE
jgi:hypothetical protein